MEQDFSILDYAPAVTHNEEQSDASNAPASTEQSQQTESEVADDSKETETEAVSSEARELALLERLEEVTGERLALERNEVAASAVADSSVAAAHDFLANLDLDEVLSSSENLNKLLLAVYTKGLQDSTNRVSDYVLNNVQQLISSHVRQQLTMSEMVKEFYDANPDLRPVRRTVAAIANEISRADPELKPPEVFAKTALRVRQVLKLNSPQVTPAAKRSFAPQRGRKVAEPELVGIEKEIMDLLT